MPRPALAVALAAAVLLAGCAAQQGGPGGDGDAAAPDGDGTRPGAGGPLTFSTPVTVGTDNAAEPNADAAPGGTLLVTNYLDLYRSTDGGANWSKAEEPFDDHGDSDLLVTPDGTRHYVGMGLPGKEGPGLPYHRKPGPDATWSEERGLQAQGEKTDRPWMNHGAGLMALAWNNYGVGENYVRVSADVGETWSDAMALPGEFHHHNGEPVVTDAVAPGGPVPSVGVEQSPRDASIYVPQGERNQLSLAVSSDGGTSWTRLGGPSTAGNVSGIPSLAVDGAGTLYVASAVDPSGGAEFRPAVWTSTDGGLTWEGPTYLGPDGSTGVFPWIEAGGAGRVAAAWYENVDGAPAGGSGTWHVRVAVRTPADGWASQRVSDGPVKEGPICQSGAGCPREEWNFRDYFELNLTPEGRPWVAYVRDADLGEAGDQAGVEVRAAVATGGWTAWGGQAEGRTSTSLATSARISATKAP